MILQIVIAIPLLCTALNGSYSVTGGELIDVSVKDASKSVNVNTDKCKFIVYGLNDTPIFAELTFKIEKTSSRFEFEVFDCVCSDKNGKALKPISYKEKHWVYGGISKKLIEQVVT